MASVVLEEVDVFCHTCGARRAAVITPDLELECTRCHKCMVERVEESADDPAAFVPPTLPPLAVPESGSGGAAGSATQPAAGDGRDVITSAVRNFLGDMQLMLPPAHLMLGGRPPPGDENLADLVARLMTLEPTGRAPATAAGAVAALPTVTVASDDEDKVCTVCQEDLETALQLPCGHKFHDDCIKPWLASHNTCPICREELVTDDPEYNSRRGLA